MLSPALHSASGRFTRALSICKEWYGMAPGSRASVAMGVGARGSAAAGGARTVSPSTAISSLSPESIPLLRASALF